MGQGLAAEPPRIEALSAEQAEQARLQKLLANQPAAYQDKVMDASEITRTEAASADDDAPAQGLRQYWVEGRYGRPESRNTVGHTRDQRSANEWGLRAELRQETLNWGEWVLQVDGRRRQGDWLNLGAQAPGQDNAGTRLTLRSIGLPITTQTFADLALGDQPAEATDSLRRGYRLMLGNSVVRGASARVYDGQTEVTGGLGARGELTGNPYPSYVRNPGQLAWLGASHRFASQWFVGAQINRATGDGGSLSDAVYGLRSATGTSAALTVGHGPEWLSDGEQRVRAIALLSRSDGQTGPARSATGLYLEGSANRSGYRHSVGAYATQPQLFFGDTYLMSDNRGLYWRVDRSGSRLSWGAGFDLEQSRSSGAPSRSQLRQWMANGNLQYRIDRQSSVGLSLNLGQTNHRQLDAADGKRGARSLFASGFVQTQFADFAPTRLRLTLRRNQTLVQNGERATGEQLEWEQEWVTGKYETMRPEVTTTLGWARDRSGAVQQTYPTAGLMLRYWLRSDWQVSGNLYYTSRSSNLSTNRGLSGSLNTELSLGGGWRAGAMLLMNQAKSNSTALGGMGGPLLTRSNDKSFYLFVRWEGSDGRSLGTGARQPGSAGAGRIRGTVYADANRDGEQQANEIGLAGVEVLLDERFRTTTDAAGRFEFPVVVTGPHRVRLRPESVPLPWGAADEAGQRIDVPLRGQAEARIPVVRVGGE